MVFKVYQIIGLSPTFLIADSGLAEIKCGAPQGYVLGLLLFLLYINDLNEAIEFCKVHHFVDDTNLLYLGKSI